MDTPDTAAIVAAIAERNVELGELLRDRTEQELLAPSLLPTWSRLTIACHLRFGAEANLAMTQAILAGREASYYPEGRERQRPSTLMLRDGETPHDVIESLVQESQELDSLWQTIEPRQWALEAREPADNVDLGPIALEMLGLLRLTEVEVHGSDLDVGCAPWSQAFVDAALPMRLRWLPKRRSNHASPDQTVNGSWSLRPTDGTPFVVVADGDRVSVDEGEIDGGNADAEIAGSKQQLLAFLLGRLPLAALTVSGDHAHAAAFTRAFPAP